MALGCAGLATVAATCADFGLVPRAAALQDVLLRLNLQVPREWACGALAHIGVNPGPRLKPTNSASSRATFCRKADGRVDPLSPAPGSPPARWLRSGSNSSPAAARRGL